MSITFNSLLTKGNSADLAVLPVDNGKIRYTTDTNQVYIDDNNVRTEVTDVVKGYTDAEIKALANPLTNKLYLSTDTNLIYIYKSNTWIAINDGSAYSTKAETVSSVTFNNDGTATLNYANGTTSQPITVYSNAAPPIVIQNTPPPNTNLVWIDSGNGYIEKVYDSSISSWITPRSVWGGE